MTETDHLLGDVASRARVRAEFGGGIVLDSRQSVLFAELLEEIEWQGSKDDEHPMREVVETARQLAEAIQPAP